MRSRRLSDYFRPSMKEAQVVASPAGSTPVRTSVQGRVARSLSLDLFADVTSATLIGIDQGGLLFDGDLTPEQTVAIWRRMTSRDETDEANRAALEDAYNGGATNLAEMSTADRLGLPLPAPAYPPPSSTALATTK